MGIAAKTPDLALLEDNEITVDAIDFNGTSSYVEYPNNLFGGWGWSTSGMVTSEEKGITVSLWIKPASGITNDTRNIVSHFKSPTSYGRESNFMRVNYDASGNARFSFNQNQDSSGNIVNVNSQYGDLTTDSWNHVLLAIKMNWVGTFTAKMYINDSSITTSSTLGELDNNSPDNDGSTFLGKFDEGVPSGYYDGCLSELWVTDTYYDLDSVGNRRLFISSDSKPVELPTSPLIYLNGSSSTWTNSGTHSLGTQTLNNITDCADSPSD
jgi:hypothetical protein